jgi:hypothetical protein
MQRHMNVEIGIEFGGSGLIKEYDSIAGDKLFITFCEFALIVLKKCQDSLYFFNAQQGYEKIANVCYSQISSTKCRRT